MASIADGLASKILMGTGLHTRVESPGVIAQLLGKCWEIHRKCIGGYFQLRQIFFKGRYLKGRICIVADGQGHLCIRKFSMQRLLLRIIL